MKSGPNELVLLVKHKAQSCEECVLFKTLPEQEGPDTFILTDKCVFGWTFKTCLCKELDEAKRR